MKRTTLLCAFVTLALLLVLGLEIANLRRPTAPPSGLSGGDPGGKKTAPADSGPSSGPDLPSKTSDRQPPAEKQATDTGYVHVLQQRIQLEGAIATMLQSGDSEAFAYAAGLDVPDNGVKAIFPKYREAQRVLTEMTTTQALGESDPKVEAQKEVITQMQKEMISEAGKLLATVKERVRQQDARFKALKNQTGEKR